MVGIRKRKELRAVTKENRQKDECVWKDKLQTGGGGGERGNTRRRKKGGGKGNRKRGEEKGKKREKKKNREKRNVKKRKRVGRGGGGVQGGIYEEVKTSGHMEIEKLWRKMVKKGQEGKIR